MPKKTFRVGEIGTGPKARKAMETVVKGVAMMYNMGTPFVVIFAKKPPSQKD